VAFFNQTLASRRCNRFRRRKSTPSRLEGVAAGLRTCEDADARHRGTVPGVFGENGTPYTPSRSARRHGAEGSGHARGVVAVAGERCRSAPTPPTTSA